MEMVAATASAIRSHPLFATTPNAGRQPPLVAGAAVRFIAAGAVEERRVMPDADVASVRVAPGTGATRT
jgi:hypothetical protein